MNAINNLCYRIFWESRCTILILNRNFSRQQKLLIFVLIGLIFSPIFLYHLTSKSIPQSNPSTSIASAAAANEKNDSSSLLPIPTQNTTTSNNQVKQNFGKPVRIKIPKIDVDSAIEYVGLKSNGEMDMAKNPDSVAWFNLSSHPGNIGSAVIAGHYGIWKSGKATVFNNLNKLVKGDQLSIEDDKGITISFIVGESRIFDPEADASEVFSSSDEKSHLNLIACSGTWDQDSKSYSKRLVVFTDKVEPTNLP